MFELTTNKRMKVIILYLQGYSYNEIVKKTGVSKGTVFNIISDLKSGLFPEISSIPEEIEQLRDVATSLKRSKLSPVEANIGLSVLERLNIIGIEPSEVEKCQTLLQALSSPDKDLPSMARSILAIEEAKQKTGLTLEELEEKVISLRREAEQLAPISEEIETKKKELTSLERDHNNLTGKIKELSKQGTTLSGHVNKLEAKEVRLRGHVVDLEERASAADKQLIDARRDLETLDKMGMTLEELNRFTIKLKEVAAHHNIKLEDLSKRLLKELSMLDKGLNLEHAIKGKEAELDRKRDEIDKGKAEIEGIHSYLKQLTSEKTRLESQITNYRKQLANDISILSAASKKTIQEINDNLESGIEVSLSEVDKLTDTAVSVGKEVGKLEASIESLSWIKPMLSLVRGENGLNNYQVRIIGLNVLRSMSSWLNENHTNNLYFLKSNINSVIGELEKWKPSEVQDNS